MKTKKEYFELSRLFITRMYRHTLTLDKEYVLYEQLVDIHPVYEDKKEFIMNQLGILLPTWINVDLEDLMERLIEKGNKLISNGLI